jgi:hypothetical protein
MGADENRDATADMLRALRVSRFTAGFAHGADPAHARKRTEGSIASDPDWRAGMEAGREAAEACLIEWDEATLRVDLARVRDSDRYKDVRPDRSVVDKLGKIVRHTFEPPHDDPGPGPCWYCLRDRDDKVHRVTKRPTAPVPF